MSEEKDLWELVRQKISDSEPKDKIETPKMIAEEKIIEEKTDEVPEVEIKKEPKKQIKETILNDDFATINLLNEGVFAGFLYIFGIMIILCI